MVDKDATKKARRNKHNEELAGEGEAEMRKNKKNATPALGGDEIQQYDDEARKKEKKIAATVAAAVLAELGIDDNDDDGVQGPKTKRNVVLENVPSDLGVASAKEKKKRIKSSTAVEDPAAEEIKSKVKKRKNKEIVSDTSDAFSSVPDGRPSKSKSNAGRKKRVAFADDTAAVVETASAPDKGAKESKKNKKRKHVDSLSTDGETIPSAPDIVAEGQLPKKKRKGETKIGDLAQDKSLSEQALKGLSYAFSQYCNPAEWKFNKARQNWLIRNVWSPAMIPDEHMPLLLWYLKNVKGGARDALVKTCQTHLQPPDQPKDESISPGQTEAETATTSLFGLSPEVLKRTSDKTQGAERSRAATILEMLEVQ